MATVAQIKEGLNCLPEKDIKIANKLLDKRDFIGLEELVNSDVYKITNKYESLLLERKEGEEPTEEIITLQTQYDAIKSLQEDVSAQAAAFKVEDEDDDYDDDDLLDYYD